MSYELQPFMSTAPPPTPRGGAQGQPTGPAQQIQRCMKAQSQIQVTIQRSLASCRELDERFLAAQKRADESAVAYLQSQPDENDLERLRQVRAEQRTALIVADKKVALASDAHDLIDRQIEKLVAALLQMRVDF